MKGRHLFASAHGDEQSDAGRYASGRPTRQRPYREPVCADADQTRLARDKLPKKSFKANGRRRASPSRALPRQETRHAKPCWRSCLPPASAWP
ncbi:MAG: hypothetical protein IPK44_24035 [Candidatus Accumulibacter sp.]|uniref:hypothetical protein n=1 Tax=Accumulibacter sp. TaxID=2053492 RepID=UPI00258A79D1|nr:hypothetical protein [Accumulibacter sp.]MBK8117361.1 hypothetical protein [Accumulibacter sp.]